MAVIETAYESKVYTIYRDLFIIAQISNLCRGCRDHDRMVVGLATTYVRVRCTTLCDKVCQPLATGRWFSLGPPVSSTNKTNRHDLTEILLKVALSTIKPNQTNICVKSAFSK